VGDYAESTPQGMVRTSGEKSFKKKKEMCGKCRHRGKKPLSSAGIQERKAIY